MKLKKKDSTIVWTRFNKSSNERKNSQLFICDLKSYFILKFY